MILIDIKDEDFVNYKKPSMFCITAKCSFKCDTESGKNICQNSPLAMSKKLLIADKDIVDRYVNNQITHAIVFGGLEPIDQFWELLALIKLLREKTDDDIVIYTGYNEDEIEDEIKVLSEYKNIIIKVGRYKYDLPSRYDEILGITLSSNNQYAIKIS